MGIASSTYCRFISARLAPAPVRIKEGGDAPPAVSIKAGGNAPPAVILGTPVVHAEGGDWGGGNPVALASSTYCRFTSARLAPAPVRIKEGGAALFALFRAVAVIFFHRSTPFDV